MIICDKYINKNASIIFKIYNLYADTVQLLIQICYIVLINVILNMNIPDIKHLKPAQCREAVIKKNYPEFYELIVEKYPDISFSEKLYWYYNEISMLPVCKNCGADVKFINSNIGYAQYCCKSCANKDINKIEKTKQVCIKKYGGIAPICSDEIKVKMKNTMLDRYGVENCQQNENISNKTKYTIINKYGGQGNASQILKTKYINTCIEKYGTDNSSKSKIVKDKLSRSKRLYVINTNQNIIDYFEENDKLMCKCRCPHIDCDLCGEKFYMIESSVLANRLSHNIELCTKILPYKSLSSSYEIYLKEFLDKYNIDYQCSVRNVISKELDIYIPSKKLAIEFNGVYHHSDARKPNNYHINKFKECQEKGIQLISIWEDQYLTKIDIVKSLILSKLGIYDTQLFARKCNIVKADAKTANDFYTSNHIQGKCSAAVHYALKYDDEIVSMMSFGKRSLGKKHNDANWELIRYCSKLNTNVVGGASRLFTRFIKDYNPNQIMSWSSNDISNGNMYNILGFEYAGISQSYWYISKNMKRYHRSNFSKSNLIKSGIVTENDKRSESQIMKELHYYKIYDSGQSKWIYTK